MWRTPSTPTNSGMVRSRARLRSSGAGAGLGTGAAGGGRDDGAEAEAEGEGPVVLGFFLLLVAPLPFSPPPLRPAGGPAATSPAPEEADLPRRPGLPTGLGVDRLAEEAAEEAAAGNAPLPRLRLRREGGGPPPLPPSSAGEGEARRAAIFWWCDLHWRWDLRGWDGKWDGKWSGVRRD